MANYIIDKVQSITESNPALNPPKTYVLVVDWHEEGSDERNVGDIYGLLQNDNEGMAPALRRWMEDHEGSYTVQPYVAPPPMPVVYRISKTTPWLRMTEDEAATMDGVMSETGARLKQIYMAATYLSSDDPLWQTLHEMLANAFGAARADQLLAPET